MNYSTPRMLPDDMRLGNAERSTPEVELWRAVLLAAIEDACHPKARPIDRDFPWTGNFAAICNIVGVCHHRLREIISDARSRSVNPIHEARRRIKHQREKDRNRNL